MAITVYVFLYFLDLFLDTHTFIGIFLQAALSALGGIVIYFIFSLLLKSPEPIALIRRIKKK